jgi:formamidopyrimidine-DNA glycosylase
MPELPEVEYTARQLRASIVGATIQGADVFWARTVGYPDLPAFLAGIAARRIEQVRRRGKFLILDLSGDLMLTIHRRMTGNLLLLAGAWRIDSSLRERDPLAWNTRGPTFYTPGAVPACIHETEYCRVCFTLCDGRRLLFTDPRKFGRIGLWPRERESEALAGLGPEPLSPEFTAGRLGEALARRRGKIKQVLLDQSVIAGVGNIYADEALFRAGIHPLRRADQLTPTEVQTLHDAIVETLTLGIEHGGTSFNDYRDLWGKAGDNYNHVRVYQREGQPCLRCGTIVERIILAQRGTHYCPGCQRLTAE